MAQNEALLPRRRLVMRLEFTAFSRRSDAVSQRLISAIAFWQTARQHWLAPQPPRPPTPDHVGARKITLSLINERQCRDLPRFNFCRMCIHCQRLWIGSWVFHVMCYPVTMAKPPRSAESMDKNCTVIAGQARISSSSALPRVSLR